jgi:hypothetical protein
MRSNQFDKTSNFTSFFNTRNPISPFRFLVNGVGRIVDLNNFDYLSDSDSNEIEELNETPQRNNLLESNDKIASSTLVTYFSPSSVEDSWEKRYGHVAWAKSHATYPWWPCLIINPNEVKIDKYRRICQRNINKKYLIIYFNYFDSHGEPFHDMATLRQLRPYIDYEHELMNQDIQNLDYKIHFSFACQLAGEQARALSGKLLYWHLS